MAISSSLYSSISGLNTMGNAMSVLGDNVSNVNTVAFKSSRATFQDVLSQSVSTAAGSAQVGRGVTLSTVDGIFAQGSFESTSNPTDMAIGGQGFFMLRASDSAEADMYSRAGEFRFDQEGYLINPVGYFVQGWEIDSETGERQGTIGDIYLGKSTPPVATKKIQAILNLDSRESNEVSETRLFDSWNGTNAAGNNPTDPIDSANYEYTSAIKVYDSQGASHDITIYFDRTTNDNEWEFLVTSDPSEDLRALTEEQKTIYAPNERYNYEEHRGAGALLYGTINFSTSGDISKISAWKVPPDGKVDPALNENRIVLEQTDKYYSFETNFTGDDTNRLIQLNLGAQFGGQFSNQAQILVSNNGAYSDSGGQNFITKETSWTSVYDSSGNQVLAGDRFVFSGYNHDGVYVSGSYTVPSSGKVQDFLDVLKSTFKGTATIDGAGRLRITDDTGGDSGMFVNSFITYSANQADPFGGGTASPNNLATTTGRLVSSDGTTAITSAATLLTNCYDTSSRRVILGDVIQLGGTDTGGNPAAANFTVTATSTIQDLLTAMENAYSATAGDVSAVLDGTGAIRLMDNTGGGQMAPSITGYTSTTAEPLGAAGNITAGSAAMFQDAGGVTPVVAGTLLTSTYDAGGDVVAVGDVFTFSGNDTNPAPSAVGPVSYTVAAGDTVQDLLDFLDAQFDATAQLTVALNAGGQITFTDASGNVVVNLDSTTQAASATPLGAAGALTLDSSSIGGQINVTTSKREVVSLGQIVSTNSGSPPIKSGSQSWNSVFDSAGNQVASGNIVFAGTKSDGSPVTVTYAIDTSGTGTVQDLLDALENAFDADVSLDGAGRLVLRDRFASASSNLSIGVTSFPPKVPNPGAGSAYLFGFPATGTAPFQTIDPDQTEDGSRMGDQVSANFDTEALASTQYANASTTIFQDQNGYAAGFLQSVSVDTDGVITGHFSNGQVLQKAQVVLATFNNMAGLKKEGGNIFTQTTESGAPVTGAPGDNGLGSIAPNSLEQSNVDLGNEFVKLITTQRGFQANSKIITTTDEMLADLINIKR